MRLRYVAQLSPPVLGLGTETAGIEVSILPLDRIWSDGRFDASQTVEFSGELQSYNPVAEGDIVLPKVSPTFTHGRVAIASRLVNGVALATSEVFVLRPHDPSDARFLKYRLLARDFLTEGEASWTGVAGLKRVSAAFVLNTRILPIAWSSRHAIADFLDRECARITELRQLLREHQSSTDELERRLIDDVFDGVPFTRLGRRAHVQTGVTLGGRYDEEEELVERPYLRVANVQADHIATHDVATVRVPSRIAARTALQSGDVLMTEGGDIDKLGRGAVWDGRIAGCLHQNHVFAVRCGDALLPELLAIWTRSSTARSYFESTASRITNIASTNLTKLLRLPVPDIDIRIQRLMLGKYNPRRTPIAELRELVEGVDRDLAEYRDALITEAVAGRLDVSCVSERQAAESASAVMETIEATVIPA